MRIRLIFAALAFVAIASCNPVNITLEFFPHSYNDESRMLVNELNSMDLPWKAEYNELASLKERQHEKDAVDYSDLKMEGLSLKESVQEQLHQDTVEHLVALASLPITLPSSFDAREKWAGCSSIHHIQDQGGCGSCWAAATTDFLSDRLCISSNYTDQRLISAQDLVSCCDFCGGCGGAWAMFPLIYWKKHGLVSGGAFGSKEGCRPYGIPATCGGPCPPYYFRAEFTPKCERTCQPNYEREYQSDLGKGRSAYHLLLREHFREDTKHGPAYERFAATMKALNISSTELIKRELLLNGPVAMETIVTEPFMHYKSGIYTYVNTRTPQSESLEYGHAMKLLGWGEESGEKYWIVANSWGRHWGEGGFGRISMEYLPHLMSAAAGLW